MYLAMWRRFRCGHTELLDIVYCSQFPNCERTYSEANSARVCANCARILSSDAAASQVGHITGSLVLESIPDLLNGQGDYLLRESEHQH